MRKIIPILAIALATLSAIASVTFPTTVTLMWTASPADQQITTYNVYQSTNAAGPWIVITNVSSTNVQFVINAPQQFWYVTATNFWGESLPSNITNTPNLATQPNGTKLNRP